MTVHALIWFITWSSLQTIHHFLQSLICNFLLSHACDKFSCLHVYSVLCLDCLSPRTRNYFFLYLVHVLSATTVEWSLWSFDENKFFFLLYLQLLCLTPAFGFPSVSNIWYVCCMLVLWQLIKRKIHLTSLFSLVCLYFLNLNQKDPWITPNRGLSFRTWGVSREKPCNPTYLSRDHCDRELKVTGTFNSQFNLWLHHKLPLWSV